MHTCSTCEFFRLEPSKQLQATPLLTMTRDYIAGKNTMKVCQKVEMAPNNKKGDKLPPCNNGQTLA